MKSVEIVEPFIPLVGTLVVSSVVAVIAFFAGRKLSISKLKLPFIDFELLENEKPDRFLTLSVAIIETEYQHIEELEKLSRTKNSDLLIYFGWHIVCDTYVNRFLQYPSEASLEKNIGELGAQNIEFIRIYRTTYERNVLGGGANHVEPDYAKSYFSRSLSLSERIDYSAKQDHVARVQRLLSRLSAETLSVS